MLIIISFRGRWSRGRVGRSDDVGRCDDDLTEKKHSYVQLYVATYAPADIRYPIQHPAKQRIILVLYLWVLVTETKAHSWAQVSRQNGFLDGVEHPKGTNQRER